MSGNEPFLMFFRSRPPDLVGRPPLASSMQTLESAFMLIALHRYPHALINIGSAIENAIKACPDRIQPRNPRRENFKEVLDSVPSSLSPQIAGFSRDSTREFRDARNEIEHRGFSPADDNRSVDLMLRIGLPLLQLCYKDLHGFELKIGLRQDMEFWRLLEAAGDIHQKAGHRSRGDYAYCLRGFQFLVRQTLQPIFVSDWENAALVEERESGWAEFEHSEKERENLESKWHSFWELDCPVCRTLDSLCVDLVLEDDYHSPVGVDKAICMDCGFYIGPDRAEPYHAKVLLNDQLVEQDRKIKSEFGIER